MKPPNLPSLSESRPVSQLGHLRGSAPSARGGNRCGASISSSASMTWADRKSTRLNSSHLGISYAVFCLKKKKNTDSATRAHSNKPNFKPKQKLEITID